MESDGEMEEKQVFLIPVSTPENAPGEMKYLVLLWVISHESLVITSLKSLIFQCFTLLFFNLYSQLTEGEYLLQRSQHLLCHRHFV